MFSVWRHLGWEFIKEKRTRKHQLVQENTHASTKKRTRSRNHALDQESVHEKRSCSRKHALLHEKEIFKLGEISINTFNKVIFVDPTN